MDADSKKSKILIVEDEGIVALDLRFRLLDLGYEILDVVDNGEDAVAATVTGEPDLILLDIRIRGQMDGIATGLEIRRHCDTPIVFLTAYSDPETIARAAAVAPSGYVVKPLNDRQLLTTIEIALRCSERRLADLEMRHDPTESLFAAKTKQHIVSICANCSRIQANRDDWVPVADFLHKVADIDCSHGLCPYCSAKMLDDLKSVEGPGDIEE